MPVISSTAGNAALIHLPHQEGRRCAVDVSRFTVGVAISSLHGRTNLMIPKRTTASMGVENSDARRFDHSGNRISCQYAA